MGPHLQALWFIPALACTARFLVSPPTAAQQVTIPQHPHDDVLLPLEFRHPDAQGFAKLEQREDRLLIRVDPYSFRVDISGFKRPIWEILDKQFRTGYLFGASRDCPRR